MTRKDDPVFNVRFVQLVENHPCLWNSTLPAYSKKEEIQKAWQEVANEAKDTVRNCRERWRTIRSSFLRSLKMSNTATGRGKRKYYLSKYLQFLIPFTKTRVKVTVNKAMTRTSTSSLVTHKWLTDPPPMTRINHIPLPLVSSNNSEDTKDTAASDVAIADEEDDAMAMPHAHEYRLDRQQRQLQPLLQPSSPPPRLINTIKKEQDGPALTSDPDNRNANTNTDSRTNTRAGSVSGVDLNEFAEWVKCKNNNSTNCHRHCALGRNNAPTPPPPPPPPDGDQSFLNSLHPFMKEMTSRQNRRFRQQVLGLIDAILDNTD